MRTSRINTGRPKSAISVNSLIARCAPSRDENSTMLAGRLQGSTVRHQQELIHPQPLEFPDEVTKISAKRTSPAVATIPGCDDCESYKLCHTCLHKCLEVLEPDIVIQISNINAILLFARPCKLLCNFRICIKWTPSVK